MKVIQALLRLVQDLSGVDLGEYFLRQRHTSDLRQACGQGPFPVFRKTDFGGHRRDVAL